MKIPLQKAYYEVLMHTICDNFSFFFTPISILVIHLFVCQLSAWSSPWLVLPFQNVQAGELTHPCRLAHRKPFQEMMWWCYLLQLWLCLYFWLKLHWKPASSAISLVLRCAYFLVMCCAARTRTFTKQTDSSVPFQQLYSAMMSTLPSSPSRNSCV